MYYFLDYFIFGKAIFVLKLRYEIFDISDMLLVVWICGLKVPHIPGNNVIKQSETICEVTLSGVINSASHFVKLIILYIILCKQTLCNKLNILKE